MLPDRHQRISYHPRMSEDESQKDLRSDSCYGTWHIARPRRESILLLVLIPICKPTPIVSNSHSRVQNDRLLSLHQGLLLEKYQWEQEDTSLVSHLDKLACTAVNLRSWC